MKPRPSARWQRFLLSTLFTTLVLGAGACGNDETGVVGDGSAPDVAAGAGVDGGTVNLNLLVGCANATGDIRTYAFGTGPAGVTLSLTGTTSAGSPVSFPALHPTRRNLLYVNHRMEGKISTFSIRPDGTLSLLGSIPVPYNVGQPMPPAPDAGAPPDGGSAPDGGASDAGAPDAAAPAPPNPSTQTVEVDATGKWLLAANYAASTVLVFGIAADGTVGTSVVSWQSTGTTAHQTVVIPGNKLVLVPYLMSHTIALYAFNDATGALTPHATPSVTVPGTTPGPRHLALHANGKWLYAINETNGTVSLFTFDETAGSLTPVESYPSIPATYTGAMKFSAEVQVHPSGKFLYVSNRLDNMVEGSLGVFSINQTDGKLTNVEFQSSRGRTPRHFTLSPAGDFLVAANQNSENLVVFSVNASTGKLENPAVHAVCSTPFFVRFIAP